MDSYRRRFGITDHAVERYRERAGDWLRERGHLDDVSVGNSLDTRVAEAWDSNRVTDVMDEGRPAKIADLESSELGRLYAVISPNNSPVGRRPWVVVTVLTGEMHDASWQSGRWQVAPEPVQAGPVVAGKPPPAALKAPEPTAFMLTYTTEEGQKRSLVCETRDEVCCAVQDAVRLGGKDFRLFGEIPLKVRVEVDF